MAICIYIFITMSSFNEPFHWYMGVFVCVCVYLTYLFALCKFYVLTYVNKEFASFILLSVSSVDIFFIWAEMLEFHLVLSVDIWGISYVIGIFFRKLLPAWISWRIILTFSSSGFRIPEFPGKTLLHFQLIFALLKKMNQILLFLKYTSSFARTRWVIFYSFFVFGNFVNEK